EAPAAPDRQPRRPVVGRAPGRAVPRADPATGRGRAARRRPLPPGRGARGGARRVLGVPRPDLTRPFRVHPAFTSRPSAGVTVSAEVVMDLVPAALVAVWVGALNGLILSAAALDPNCAALGLLLFFGPAANLGSVVVLVAL